MKVDKAWTRLYVFMTTFGLGLAMIVANPHGFFTVALKPGNLVSFAGQVLLITSFVGVVITILQLGRNAHS